MQRTGRLQSCGPNFKTLVLVRKRLALVIGDIKIVCEVYCHEFLFSLQGEGETIFLSHKKLIPLGIKRCLQGRYCSHECQKEDWALHEGFCRERQNKRKKQGRKKQKREEKSKKETDGGGVGGGGDGGVGGGDDGERQQVEEGLEGCRGKMGLLMLTEDD